MQQPALPVPTETQTVAHTEAAHEPTLLGLGVEDWVYVSITLFFVLAIFVARAHRTIVTKLDEQIAETRKELDEARRVRTEAEALLRETQARRAEGVATVRFSLDAAGHVVAAALARSSGVPVLDAESLALIRRAEPFPAPPSGMPVPIEITVPVRFSFR